MNEKLQNLASWLKNNYFLKESKKVIFISKEAHKSDGFGFRVKEASRTVSRPEYGYHSTFLHNLDSIASHGLRPSEESQFGGGYSGHSQGRVFLSDWHGVSFWMSKMEDIANYNSDFKTEDDFGWTPIVLRVDIDGLEGKLSDDELGRRDSGQSAAWYIEETVDPDFIEVWNGSNWVPAQSADPDAMMDQSRNAAFYESDEDEEYDEWGEPTGWWEINFDVFMPIEDNY